MASTALPSQTPRTIASARCGALVARASSCQKMARRGRIVSARHAMATHSVPNFRTLTRCAAIVLLVARVRRSFRRARQRRTVRARIAQRIRTRTPAAIAAQAAKRRQHAVKASSFQMIPRWRLARAVLAAPTSTVTWTAIATHRA